MELVLTPILKSAVSNKPPSTSMSRVTFDLPFENESVIEYLKSSSELPYEAKLRHVVKAISSPDADESALLRWINEFKDNILFLDKENECITFALLNLNWSGRDQRFVILYHEFILNLVTAHTSFLRVVLSMIIRNFLPVSDSNDITDEEKSRFQNVHILLKYIIELVPLSPYPLCTMLSEKFPYMKSLVHRLHCYLENVLHISSYLLSKRQTILERVVEKLIHIDVNCSRDIIEMYEAQKEEESILQSQEVDDQSSSEKLDNMAYPLAHSLDVLMNCMFQYVHNVCFSAEKSHLNWDATKKLYKEMLAVFDKIILPTHGSCHVQYIMFYICSLKQELCDGFLDYLWKKVQNPNIAPVFRQLAAFYIGSLLSRARYINLSTLTACLDLMCSWIHNYIDNHAVQDLNVHSTFHCVCQTVFYSTCFRCDELMEMPNGHKFIRGLNFDRIVTCRLNPLRYCDKNIVQNFANISKDFQITYVYPVIERNNRDLLYASLEQNVESSNGVVIHTFFPFDPYLLKRSKHWIESLYRIFSHSHKDEEMDQADDDIPVDDITPFLCGSFKKINVAS